MECPICRYKEMRLRKYTMIQAPEIKPIEIMLEKKQYHPPIAYEETRICPNCCFVANFLHERRITIRMDYPDE